ncbi:MAG: response regulator [Ignavibacteria bacterium]|nr:response regulator [Ignavibacteria bacterium]
METNDKLRILVAEDDAVNQFIIEKMFDKKNYDLVIVNDGSEVFQEIKKNDFDVILMDVNMPNMDGIEATEKIRKKEEKTGKHIPIIGITAFSDEDERDNYLAIGMDDFLPKPFLDKNLKEVVNRCLA